MAPKEPTRAQLSSRLTYNSGDTPAFLRRLQNKISGTVDSDEGEEFEDDGSGRPPIPRRPAIPERPDDDPGSGNEDDRDEAPQIVVLREGKHLSQWEVENEKRKAKGLPPLSAPSSSNNELEDEKAQPPQKKDKEKARESGKSLSFSTSTGLPSKASKKRKAVAVGGDVDSSEDVTNKKVKKKKPKVGLSFADDAA